MANEERKQSSKANIPTLSWVGDIDGYLRLIDQTRLPTEFVEIECRGVETLWEAIKSLRVRGAPAIGIAAAYGVCLGLQSATSLSEEDFFTRLDEVAGYLAGSRPTAVNLFWAIERMKRAGHRRRGEAPLRQIRSDLLVEARAIHEEDRQMCRAMGRHGAGAVGRRPGGSYALQRRRFGHLRLWHGPGRVLCRGRIGQADPRLCRRDAAALAGRPADRLGTAREGSR